MKSNTITTELLTGYSDQFKKIDTCIHDFQVVLNQKNTEDLTWVLPRIDSFKNKFHPNFIEEIIIDLKERKLGKSINDIKLHICANWLLSEIENIISLNIIEEFKLNSDDWIKNKDIDHNNVLEIYYNLNKFTMWVLLEVRSLILIWDKKNSDSFPITEFVEYQNKIHSLEFKTNSELEKYIEINKDKTRLYLFKGKIISIESHLKSAKYYLSETTRMIQG